MVDLTPPRHIPTLPSRKLLRPNRCWPTLLPTFVGPDVKFHYIHI
jgi:hypothetical protein